MTLPNAVKIRRDAADLLISAARDAKAGHHFVKNQDRTVLRALLAEQSRNPSSWEIQTGIGRHRFDDDCRDRLLPSAMNNERNALDVIERQRRSSVPPARAGTPALSG